MRGTAADAVVDRLRQVYEVGSDADLARHLDVGTSTISNWRSRGTVPYPHCVEVARRTGTALDWLVLGLGPRQAQAREDPAPYLVAGVPVALPLPGPAPNGHSEPDPRLAAVLAWWQHWWVSASEADRTWAIVQLRRAFPEAAEWLRRCGIPT